MNVIEEIRPPEGSAFELIVELWTAGKRFESIEGHENVRMAMTVSGTAIGGRTGLP